MALNGKYVSIKRLMEELYRDMGYQYEIPWEDCISWTDDCLNLIGHPQQYVRKVTGYKGNPNLDIVDYRAVLPCDIHEIEQIAVNGYSARYSGNTMHHLLSGKCCGLDITSQQPIELFTDNFGNVFSPQLSATNDTTQTTEITYDINNNFLTLNVKTGKVCIAYLAVPIDEEGFPLIPDDISFRQAVKKYLTMRLDYIEWRRGNLPNDVFKHSELEWCFYVGQAANKAKAPNVAMMEGLKNQILRLKPEINHYQHFFKNLGSQEQRKMH